VISRKNDNTRFRRIFYDITGGFRSDIDHFTSGFLNFTTDFTGDLSFFSP
jgi:hypothetical protein